MVKRNILLCFYNDINILSLQHDIWKSKLYNYVKRKKYVVLKKINKFRPLYSYIKYVESKRSGGIINIYDFTDT